MKTRPLLALLLASTAALLVACQGSTYSLGYPDDSVRDGGSSGSTGSGRTTGGSRGSTGATMSGASSGGSVGSTSAGSSGSTGASSSSGSGTFDAGGTTDSSGSGTTSSGTTGADARAPRCGDGLTEPPEQCDDGNTVGTDDCTGACKLPACGDGVVWTDHEECDDGNLVPGDGCSASCHFEPVLLAAGWAFSCALSSGGTVKCWGYNHDGELGLGDFEDRGDQPGEMGDNLPVVSLGAGRRVTAIVAGGYGSLNNYACALLDDGLVKCWGNNDYGQLGLGDKQWRGYQPDQIGDNLPAVNLGTGRRAMSIAAGDDHTCALLDDGSVKCWGGNSSGQLGLGDTENRGDGPGEMGDNLPAVDLGLGRRATSVAAGVSRSCALLDDLSLKCWGENSQGTLGLGDTLNRGDAPGEMGDNLPAIDLGTGRHATGVAAGWSHTCALLDDSSVKCWGSKYFGALGLGDTANRGDQLGEMGDNLPTVSLGTGRHATGISAGDGNACASLDDGSLKCWGYNDPCGELGLGDTENRGDQPGEMGDNLPAVDVGF